MTVDGRCVSDDITKRYNKLPSFDELDSDNKEKSENERDEDIAHTLFMLQLEICDTISSAIIQPNLLNNNTPLSQFCKRLNKVIKDDREIGADFHTDNALFRRTQHGAQFVIADPVVSTNVLASLDNRNPFNSMGSF